MRKIFMLFVLVTMVAMVSQQAFGFFAELDNKIADGKIISKNINLATGYRVNTYVGVSAFSLTSKTWSEVYVGPEFYLTKWLRVGVSGGIETAPKSWRAAGSLWLGTGPVSLFAVYEDGGSGWWYHASCSYQATKWLAVGVLSKRFLGTGPQIMVSIPHTPFQVWGSMNYDSKDEKIKHKQMVGVRIVN